MAQISPCLNTSNFNHPTPGSGRAKNETMTREEIVIEVNKVFDYGSGVNELKVTNLIERFVKIAEKETRHIAAEIAGTAESPDQAHRQIMNISILKQWF